tara:strand:+ start:178 stop:345 length:168 start_codon:yes stop_codon:yes gene_type:complete
MRIKKCAIRLDYEDCESQYYVLDLDFDKDIYDQIYNYFYEEVPTFIWFEWEEISI